MKDEAEAIGIYDRDAAALAAQYDRPELLAAYYPIKDLLQEHVAGATALDIGAGSGRDAAWLADLGYEVVAVEPAAGMRREAIRRHPSDQIRWLDDRLPSLDAVHRLAISFDVILVAAVWQHIASANRPRAMRKLTTLLKPGGLLVLTLREGPPPADRPMHATSVPEVEGIARMHGLEMLRVHRASDAMGRADVAWNLIVLRMPDDGAGALPLLRGIILTDDKSSTYKLALLRAVARIAEYYPATATPVIGADRDVVDVPLGLVAANWIRMYLPLVNAGLPQAPKNSGPDGLGFAKAGFRGLTKLGIHPTDLRPGAVHTGESALAVRAALNEAVATIVAMPANFVRFPNSDRRVFEAAKSGVRGRVSSIALDVQTLGQWGTIAVPGNVWRAMARFGAWIEPVLVNEWARVTKRYAARMGLALSPGAVEGALEWSEPIRSTAIARAACQRLLDSDRSLICVWSGKALTRNRLDVDHCFPWAVWPCGDLWNLLPADRSINQQHKRDKLPSGPLLSAARDRIVNWWEDAWLSDPALGDLFAREAKAALAVDDDCSAASVFTAMDWRRFRLRQDQQLPEWNPAF